MGVIDPIPSDLMALYGDGYYGTGDHAAVQQDHGYSDHAFTAEHGVAWAAALASLLRPAGGSVLDIGCVDGHLLMKLGRGYDLFGIEANVVMGARAAERGIAMLGRDLLDPGLAEHHAARFDVITAIAVFEHLPDIRAGMAMALTLLRTHGVLLFEVPLMSAIHDNWVWLTSSLEHVWYPSEGGLRHLVEHELGARLLGTELFIEGYGSTYVGLVFRDGADIDAIRRVFECVIMRRVEPASEPEAIARMLLHVVHAAVSDVDDIAAITALPPGALNPALIRRFTELWQAQVWRTRTATVETNRVQVAWEQEVAQSKILHHQIDQAAQAHSVLQAACDQSAAQARRLQADLDISVADRIRSLTELTAGIVIAQGRVAALESDLAAQAAAAAAVNRQQAELVRDRAMLADAEARLAAEQQTLALAHAAIAAREQAAAHTDAAAQAALRAVQAVQSSTVWHVAAVLRHAGQRNPRLARLAGRAVRWAWWTAQGRLLGQLKLRAQVRRQLRLTTPDPASVVEASTVEAATVPHPMLAPARPLPNAAEPADRPAPGVLAMLEATGHRPHALLAGADDPALRPLVSVVVTSFNYGRFVGDAIDSVLAQTFKDLEIIVVEGGSSQPESRFTVAGLHGPRLRILMQGPGHRAGANRNYGISQARGRYICCLDADDKLAPTYIEKAVFLLERHGVDVVSSAMENFGRDQGVVNIMERPTLADLLDGNQVLTCAVYRRCLWEQAGGYRDADVAVSGYVYEDWAFWIRLAALGARFRNYYHDPMLRYRVHGSSLSRAKGVHPMWRQRELVREMNADVLSDLPALLERSLHRADLSYATPLSAPASVELERSAVPTVHRPTLLLAMPFLILGGAERLLSMVVGHLVRSGWRVVITTTIRPGTDAGDTSPWFEQHTPELFHLPRGLPPELWEDFFHHLIRSRHVDIMWVVGSAIVYDLLRGLRAAHPGLRVADLLFNTVGHTENNRRRRALIDLIFVENLEVRDWLLARDETADRIRLVESGVDLAGLRATASSKPEPRDRQTLTIGFCGRWSEEKNPVGYIRIAALVDPALPVRFVMTGTGPMRPVIEQAIAAAAFAPGRFTLLGEVPEIASVLASLDLLVLPSLLDGRPMVVLEAMALGVPVLASRVGALPELVADGRTGWLREAEDEAGFAACIEHIAIDRPALQAMQAAARAYADAHFDVRRMVAAYEAGLASLLPAAPGP